MYDYIKGKFTYKNETSKMFMIVIEAFGVGYSIEVPYKDFISLTDSDADIKIYVALIHREDKMSLCGFLKREDRDMFNILNSVSGVGAKMALTLLNSFSVADLISIVLNQDYKSLTVAKGVGQKLAQKIILELKDKLNESKDIAHKSSTGSDCNNERITDAKSVLLSLGYENSEINSALQKAVELIDLNSTAEDILKKTLQILSV